MPSDRALILHALVHDCQTWPTVTMQLHYTSMYSHLSNKRGVSIIFFQILRPSSQKFLPLHLLIFFLDFFTLLIHFVCVVNLEMNSPRSCLFPPCLLIQELFHPFSFIPSFSAIREIRIHSTSIIE